MTSDNRKAVPVEQVDYNFGDPRPPLSVNLMACPLCGGQPKQPYFGETVVCVECTCSAPTVVAWNTRSPAHSDGEVVGTARDVISQAVDHYTARNGRRMSIEGDDGEKCWIVPFDALEGLRGSLERLSAAPTSDVLDDGWLICQLEAWPTRIDPERTINIEYLMKAAAKRLRGGDVPDGWCLVPREPAEAMLSEGQTVAIAVGGGITVTLGRDELLQLWSAMLSAAPTKGGA